MDWSFINLFFLLFPMKNSKEHVLKIRPEFLQSLLVGQKTCEVRFNDRDYQAGDFLVFEEEEPYMRYYFRITHVLNHDQFPDGIKEGYVVLSISQVPDAK